MNKFYISKYLGILGDFHVDKFSNLLQVVSWHIEALWYNKQ